MKFQRAFIPKMCVCEIWIRSLVELMVLHECKFPGFTNLLWFCKMLSFRVTGWMVGSQGLLILQVLGSQSISKWKY